MKEAFRIGGSTAVLLGAALEKEQRLSGELAAVRKALKDFVEMASDDKKVDVPPSFQLGRDGTEIVVLVPDDPQDDQAA